MDVGQASLLEKSLIAATKNMPSLGDVLVFCDSREDFSSSCSKASAFWKVTIGRTLGKWKVLQRGDLAEDDWYYFARLLDSGLEFKYAMTFDGTNGMWSTIALPYSSIREDKTLQVNQDLNHFQFSIPGAVPAAGTNGYFISFAIHSNTGGRKRIKKFIVGPDMNRNFILAAQLIGEKYFKFHKIYQVENGDFFDEQNHHPDVGNRPPFPNNPEYFRDKILDIGPDPVTGHARQEWFVYYTNQVTLKNYNTTADFDIIPFSF